MDEHFLAYFCLFEFSARWTAHVFAFKDKQLHMCIHITSNLWRLLSILHPGLTLHTQIPYSNICTWLWSVWVWVLSKGAIRLPTTRLKAIFPAWISQRRLYGLCKIAFSRIALAWMHSKCEFRFNIPTPYRRRRHIHWHVCQTIRTVNFTIIHVSIVHFKRLGSRHIHKEIEIS